LCSPGVDTKQRHALSSLLPPPSSPSTSETLQSSSESSRDPGENGQIRLRSRIRALKNYTPSPRSLKDATLALRCSRHGLNLGIPHALVLSHSQPQPQSGSRARASLMGRGPLATCKPLPAGVSYGAHLLSFVFQVLFIRYPSLLRCFPSTSLFFPSSTLLASFLPVLCTFILFASFLYFTLLSRILSSTPFISPC